MVDELDLEFSREMLARQGQLQDTQAILRRATADLADSRRTLKECRAQALQLTEAQQKVKNLEQSLEEEKKKARSQKGYTASMIRSSEGQEEIVDEHFNVKQSVDIDTSSMAPEAVSAAREARAEEQIILLRARIRAYEQNSKELEQELVDVKDRSLEKELQCRKVISICCNIPLEKVDEMLVPLTLAVESDGASLDLSRVAGFMSKVKQQDGVASSMGLDSEN